MDAVGLLASSGHDLQCALEQFECKAARMRVSSSKSKAKCSQPEKGGVPLWVRDESLPQTEEFKYLRFLFTSEGKL